MKCSIRVTACAALFALWALCSPSVMAQDPAKVAPEMYKVRLENARVRVLEVNAKAGQKAALHKHPVYLVYNLSDGKVRFTDGKSAASEAEMKAGEVMWRDAETHTSEALTDFRALLFELKGSKGGGAPRPADGPDPATADPAHFKVLLDNDRVRVLDFRASAGEKVSMHGHPDYITYDLSGGKSRFTYPKGKPADRLSKAGDVAWHKAETHASENVGGADIHVLLVELK